MTLIRWEPFRELDDIFSRYGPFLGRLPNVRQGATEEGDTPSWTPLANVSETETEYLIKADLPAVKREDVKVSVEDGILAVEGERKMEKEEKNKKFHRIERSYGKFVRRMAVPSDVDQQKLQADFKDGVLNVHLPKSPVAKPRSVDVKIA